MLRKVVFLDRDGVINRDSPHYIKSVAEFEFLPGSLEALRLLSANGFSLVVATNQSAVNRGWISADTLAAIHRLMCAEAAAHGARICDILVCPHRPEEGCGCRKPEPGLLLAAGARHRIDLSAAVMIGDSVKDIECGVNAGVGKTVLVRTGNGVAAEQELARGRLAPDMVVDDLMAAARGLLVPGHQAADALGRPGP
jgi:D-glycero-D-manno-heptose 1,7-bisphosphate phosphatase